MESSALRLIARKPDPVAPQQRRRLLDRMRDRLRLKHYSIRTEPAYVDWVIAYSQLAVARAAVGLVETSVLEGS